MPRKTFVAGEILTAADVNTNLMDQAVMVFADAAARTTAIPSPSEGMVTYLSDVNRVEIYTGAAFVPVNTGFTARQTITATDATWSVPSLASPIVKVTVIGGGGGGGGSADGGGGTNAGTGGTTTFDAGGAGTVSANGGLGGKSQDANIGGSAGTDGFSAGNQGGGSKGSTSNTSGTTGCGGAITVSYLNLSGISTVNVTIGAGGTAGSGNLSSGGAGGRGEVIVEYVAG
jgi:hypothetical protein